MKIDRSLWIQFQTYLYTDGGLRGRNSARNVNKSNFFKVVDLMDGHEFTRKNFSAVIVSLENKFKPSYINNFIKIAQKIDDYLVVEFNQPRQLFKFKYIPAPQNVDFEIVTVSEIKKLAKVRIQYGKSRTFLNQRNRALILTLAEVGGRGASEILELKHENLKSEPHPHFVIKNTKTNVDRRVPIRKSLYALLMKLPKDGEFIFSSSRGNRQLNLSEVNLDLKARAKAIGLNKIISTKTFRQSKITRMADNGADWFKSSLLIGHSDPKSTLRYYRNSMKSLIETAQTDPLWGTTSPERKFQQLNDLLSRIYSSNSDVLEIIKDGRSVSIKINPNNKK